MDITEYRNRNDYFTYLSNRQEHDRIYKDLRNEDLQGFNEVDRIALSLFSLIIIAIIIVIVVSVFRKSEVCECSHSNGAVYETPVVVTSQSHTAPQGTTVVQSGYYPPGTAPQGGVVYPPQSGYQPGQYPQYPPAQHPQQPIQPPHQPYPVHQNAPVVGVQPPAGFNENPPSYDQVQQDNTMYTKQPPYNPSYTGQQ